MEDPVQGRELSQRMASQEPRRNYLGARASGRWEVVVAVRSLHSGLRTEIQRAALALGSCVSEGTLLSLPEPQRVHL